jgi:hypothetical protein
MQRQTRATLIYDVAIPGPAVAAAAVRKECGADPETIVEPVAELPSGTGLRNGKVLRDDLTRKSSRDSMAAARMVRRHLAGTAPTNPC